MGKIWEVLQCMLLLSRSFSSFIAATWRSTKCACTLSLRQTCCSNVLCWISVLSQGPAISLGSVHLIRKETALSRMWASLQPYFPGLRKQKLRSGRRAGRRCSKRAVQCMAFPISFHGLSSRVLQAWHAVFWLLGTCAHVLARPPVSLPISNFFVIPESEPDEFLPRLRGLLSSFDHFTPPWDAA